MRRIHPTHKEQSCFFRKKSILHIREITNGVPRLIFSLLLRMSGSFVIFNSQHTQDTYKFAYYRRGDVIHNGVQGFLNISPINFSSRNAVRILHLGRFNPRKGQHLLLDAISELTSSERTQIEVQIIGSVLADQVWYKKKLLQQINDYDLNSSVSVLPFTKFTEQVYQWADVVVVSSIKPESFGLVAIEAMSAGRCVVAADQGGLLEIITHSEDGLFFKSQNASDLKSSISRVINDTELMMKLGESGRETFKKKFSQECYMQNFQHYLESNFG